RVRYPESAVLSAVSARALRGPGGEVENCRTGRPSREVALMGVSMTSPEGLGMRTPLPASWRACSFVPRAAGSGLTPMRVDLALGWFDALHLGEHLVGDFFRGAVPDVDDLVVALTGGDGAVETLALDLEHGLAGRVDDVGLLRRDDHVVDADGDAGLGGVEE